MKRYILLAITSAGYMTYYWLFLAINKAGMAVMQLEDSDVAYAIGAGAAKSGFITDALLVVAMFALAWSIIKLLTGGKKNKDSN